MFFFLFVLFWEVEKLSFSWGAGRRPADLSPSKATVGCAVRGFATQSPKGRKRRKALLSFYEYFLPPIGGS